MKLKLRRTIALDHIFTMDLTHMAEWTLSWRMDHSIYHFPDRSWLKDLV